MRGFILGTAATAVAFWIVINLLPDFFSYDGELVGLILLALVFGLVNGLIGPVVRLLALPLSFMTLGLFGFIVNAGLLLLTALLADTAGLDFQVGSFPPELDADTVVAAIIGAVVLGVVNSLVHMVAPD